MFNLTTIGVTAVITSDKNLQESGESVLVLRRKIGEVLSKSVHKSR